MDTICRLYEVGRQRLAEEGDDDQVRFIFTLKHNKINKPAPSSVPVHVCVRGLDILSSSRSVFFQDDEDQDDNDSSDTDDDDDDDDDVLDIDPLIQELADIEEQENEEQENRDGANSPADEEVA